MESATEFLEKELIDKDVSDVLERATKRGYNEVVKLLVDMGAHITHAILCYAVEMGNLELVQLFLEKSDRPRYIIECTGNYAIKVACDLGYYDIVCLLIKYGANVCTGDNYPLRVTRNTKIMKLLVDHGADITVLSQKQIDEVFGTCDTKPAKTDLYNCN